MGSSHSSTLQVEEIDQLLLITNFNSKSIRHLWRRFKRLDKKNVGYLTSDILLMIPELQVNPISKRVIQMFDASGEDVITFRQFAQILSTFSYKGSFEEKIHFIFRVYDLDGDGFISGTELFEVLKTIVGENLTDTHLAEIVDKTIAEVDTTKTGKICFADFYNAVKDSEGLEQKLTIKF